MWCMVCFIDRKIIIHQKRPVKPSAFSRQTAILSIYKVIAVMSCVHVCVQDIKSSSILSCNYGSPLVVIRNGLQRCLLVLTQ